MGMKVKYVGPKDVKRFNGQLFPRLVPIEVSNTEAAKMLAFPDVFLPADMDVPHETLALREQLPAAMIREGEARIEEYTVVKARAMAMPHGNIVKETGKPDWTMQKRLDAMQGAQDEIDAGNRLIEEAKRLQARLKIEATLALAQADDPGDEAEPQAEEPAEEAEPQPKARRKKAEALA